MYVWNENVERVGKKESACGLSFSLRFVQGIDVYIVTSSGGYHDRVDRDNILCKLRKRTMCYEIKQRVRSSRLQIRLTTRDLNSKFDLFLV